MCVLIAPLLSRNPFHPCRNVFSTSFSPLFCSSAHPVAYRGTETGIAAFLLTLTRLPFCSFMRSKFSSCTGELKHRGNGSLFYHFVTPVPVDPDIVGKSFIYVFSSLMQTQKGVLAKVVLQRQLLPIQQSATQAKARLVSGEAEAVARRQACSCVS